MNKFIKNSILILLTFSLTANAGNKNKRKKATKSVPTKQAPTVEPSTTYISTTNVPQNTTTAFDTQNETVAFIDELNRNLPQIIQDINSAKSNLSKMLIGQIRETYKGTVGFLDLIKAMFPFRKSNLDDRLLPLAGYLTIEAILLKAISNLQTQKDSGIDENDVRAKAVTLRTTLNNSLNQYLHLSSDLNAVNPTNAQITPAVKEILEKLNYKQIPETLGVKDARLKAEFYENVQKNASCLLTSNDQAILTGFVNGAIFQRMKNATNSGTVTNFSNTILRSLPASAQDLINQAKTKVLAS